MKKFKKGFTLLELVIVIAVVAILAAVMIPTFSSLINKARISNDTLLTRNLNTIAESYEADNGKPKSVDEILDAIADNGYTVEKLTPVSKQNNVNILWDSKTNRFVLMQGSTVLYSDGKVSDNIDLWLITDTYTDELGFSVYLKSGYKGVKTLNITTGLDVGKNENIEVINYVRGANAEAQDVVIRTNGGTLNINAKNDSVRHYNTSDKVIIEAVASASYHENGKVIGNIEIKKGRVVLEQHSEVNTVLVKSTEVGSVVVKCERNAQVASVVATTEAGKTDITSEASIVPATVVVEEVLDETVLSKFAGGLGTEPSPYLIETVDHIKTMSSAEFDGQDLYYRVNKDITFTDDDWGTREFLTTRQSASGVLDGNNHKFIFDLHTDKVRYLIEEPDYAPLTFKNLTLVVGEYMAGLSEYSNYGVTFENITIVNAEGVRSTNVKRYQGALISQPWRGYAKLINIDYKANLNQTDSTYVGVFIANYASTKFMLKNCVYSGTFNGATVGLVLANNSKKMQNWTLVSEADFDSATYSNTYQPFCIVNVKNEGVLHGTVAADILGRAAGTADDATTINALLAKEVEMNIARGNMSYGSEEITLAVENGKVKYSDQITGQSTYRIETRISVSMTEGSNYVTLYTDNQGATLIKQIIGSDKYATAYASITGAEYTSADGWSYKLVDAEGGKIAVVDVTSNPFPALGDPIMTGAAPLYTITVYNESGCPIASETFTYASLMD